MISFNTQNNFTWTIMILVQTCAVEIDITLRPVICYECPTISGGYIFYPWACCHWHYPSTFEVHRERSLFTSYGYIAWSVSWYFEICYTCSCVVYRYPSTSSFSYQIGRNFSNILIGVQKLKNVKQDVKIQRGCNVIIPGAYYWWYHS